MAVTTARFPGIPVVADGSEAYPITPSTTMAALYQAAVDVTRALAPQSETEAAEVVV